MTQVGGSNILWAYFSSAEPGKLKIVNVNMNEA